MQENTTLTNTAEGGNATPGAGEKTFTQEQLNAIVGERLAKEKAKAEADIAQREREVQRKEFVLTARETLTQRGLPLEMLDALNTSSPEAFAKSLDILQATGLMPVTTTTGYRPATPPTQQGHDANADIRRAMGLK